MSKTPDTEAEATTETETDEHTPGAEWGSPAEVSEFPPEPEPAEPRHEPGPNDEAR